MPIRRPALALDRGLAATLVVTLTLVVAACSAADEEASPAGTTSPAQTSSAPATDSPSDTGSPSDTAAPTGTASPSPTDTAPASPSPGAEGDDVRTLEITITGREVSPAPSTLDLARGEKLRLVITADQDMELHAHGLGEVEAELIAGQPVTIELSTGSTGQFEVETHDPNLRLLLVAVR